VDRVVDAAGQVVVAGGIELRGRVAAYGLDWLRLQGLAPPLPRLGTEYALLGYTHVHEPFLTLGTAAYVHRDLSRLPLVDTSASLLLNLRDMDLWLRTPERLPEVLETVCFLLEQTRTVSFWVAEPYVRYRQEFYRHRAMSLEAGLEVLTRLAQTAPAPMAQEASPELLEAGLPEPRLLHLSGLSQALIGEAQAAGAEQHLARGGTTDPGLLPPMPALAAGAAPVRMDWGGFQPLELTPDYTPEQARLSLALALNHLGPGLALSRGQPWASPLDAYPAMSAWLWDQEARRREWGGELSQRQPSLLDWVWATRTLPARLLGLADRGHLAAGALADLAIYDLPPDALPAAWGGHLGRCRTLLKRGQVVVDNFQLVAPDAPKATWRRVTGAGLTSLVEEMAQYRSQRLEHLGVPAALAGPWAQVG
jgi:formylmethanofuran dehydrogenase subunit A